MPDNIEDNCVSCDRKVNCFNHLSEDELKLFNTEKVTVRYKKGETILKQGTEFTHVVSFNDGLAKVNLEIGNNKNVLIGLLKESEILGGPGMFVENKYAFTVSAVTECSICLINVNTFKKILRSNDAFSEKFLSDFSSRYTQSIQRLVNINHKQVHGRLADALLYFSEKIYDSERFELAISRQELADFTGMSKESISRILHELNQDEVIISHGRHFEIKDKEKLTHLMRTG